MISFAEFMGDDIQFAGMTTGRDGDFSIQRLSEEFGVLSEIVPISVSGIHLVEQVHGTEIVRAKDPVDGVSVLGPADGLLTNRPGIALGVRAADCTPVFLYCSKSKSAAVVHAGREGTRQRIAAHAVAELVEHCGAEPSAMRGMIGPSAGPCCYEVDPETAAGCAESGMAVTGRQVDLWRSNRDQLAAAGVPIQSIAIAEICTICTDSFHSYRRTGGTDRNLAVLVL